MVTGLILYGVVMTILLALACAEFKLQAMLKCTYWQTLQDIYKLLDETRRELRNTTDSLMAMTSACGAASREAATAQWHLQKVTAKLTTVAAEKRDALALADNVAAKLTGVQVSYANMSENYGILYAAYERAQARIKESESK